MSNPTVRLNAALEGRYAIERELGEGGMATVYLAEDLKHHRNIALKVLKPELAAIVGAERFLAEIETTANLQHPHILPLFDSGEADGFLFYVMPYVEGESLRDRLDRDKQLPVDEAVRIAAAVANALQAAHDNGVIHRDIKPANILLSGGEPLVADFGIALAVGAAGGGRLTETGLSLGTPHYMSPEQATGDQTVAPATDIYALGCVLYEMLVGEPPYTGGTAQIILGKIITGEPVSATKTRASVPANVDAAIRKALEKLPADRFRDAGAFTRALVDSGFRHGVKVGSTSDVHTARWGLTAVLATTTLLLAIAFGWAVTALRRGDAPATSRFEVTPRSPSAAVGDGVGFSISADGRYFVYAGEAPGGGTQLWLRSLESLDPEPIPGTEGASDPALSRDGQMLAFRVGGVVQTVSLSGGLPVPIGEGTHPTWGPDGALYFEQGQIIHQVQVGGGPPRAWTTLVDADQILPSVLPDGRGTLLTIRRSVAAQSRIAVVGSDGGTPREILTGTMARYAESGHIVYTTYDGTLLAAPFDLNRLEAGTPVALVGGVRIMGNSATHFALSESGTLLYQLAATAGTRELVWVDRNGVAESIDPSWTGGAFPSLSPDGTRVALSYEGDLWVKPLDGTPAVRLTFEGENLFHPTWTPDGDSVSLNSGTELRTRRADGGGQPVLTATNERGIVAPKWSRDGTWLIYRTNLNLTGRGDILSIRPGQDSVPRELVATEGHDLSPTISPNGRWLAYSSDETGENQVYVVPFPNSGDGKWAVSGAGGFTPVWSHSGNELFYRTPEAMMAVQIEAGATFRAGASTVLFPAEDYDASVLHPQYDVAPDDSRFLMIRQTGGDDEPRMILVQNFFEELKRLVPN